MIDTEKEQSKRNTVAESVIENYVARALLTKKGNNVEIKIYLWTPDKSVKNWYKEPRVVKLVYKQNIKIENLNSDIYADIRFIPRREGVFRKKEDSGVSALISQNWLKENHGIKIYDREFAIKPYGYGDNDWLKLSLDNATSERDPRSNLSKIHHEMDNDTYTRPKINWMLNLPNNQQTVGAVFVQSSSVDDSKCLIPNMDRQGFVENQAYNELFELIRYAIELIAKFDKDAKNQEEKLQRDAKSTNAQGEILSTIEIINSSPGLTPEDKDRLITSYQSVYENISSVEDYDREARESMDVMSLLGVIAGFMTHEYQSALTNMQDVSHVLDELSKEDEKFIKYKQKIDKNIDYFNDYIQYSQAYIYRSSNPKYNEWKVLPRIKHIANTFSGFCRDRNIITDYPWCI